MSESLINEMKERISIGEQTLTQVREIIKSLKIAGEDTKTIERQYAKTKAKIDRYKKAFNA